MVAVLIFHTQSMRLTRATPPFDNQMQVRQQILTNADVFLTSGHTGHHQVHNFLKITHTRSQCNSVTSDPVTLCVSMLPCKPLFLQRPDNAVPEGKHSVLTGPHLHFLVCFPFILYYLFLPVCTLLLLC